jgi:hypothetical protein
MLDEATHDRLLGYVRDLRTRSAHLRESATSDQEYGTALGYETAADDFVENVLTPLFEADMKAWQGRAQSGSGEAMMEYTKAQARYLNARGGVY